ncbi:MAG: hypothetical protein Sapg2KO_12870 [Saprospiraceae bacterium]
MKQGLLFIFSLCMVTMIGAQTDLDSLVQPQPKSLFRSDPITEPSVVFGPQANVIYFSRKGATFNFGKANQTDIWMAYAENEYLQWKSPINLGPQINSEADEQVVSINLSGNRLYFTKNIDQQTQLFVIEKQGRRWGVEQRVAVPGLPSFKNIKSYSVSADEQTLFLCGSKDSIDTQADIFYSRKGIFGQWSYPTRLSLPMNMQGDECSVFLAADNKSLFFASNGLSGLGGYDLYYSKKNTEGWSSWSQPQNMGPSVNTSANEYGLSMPLSGNQMAFISDIMGKRAKIFQLQTPALFQPDEVEMPNGSEDKTETLEPDKGFNH